MAGSMVFATVGTTKFTALMETLDKEEIQTALAAKGFKRLLIQTGNSTVVPTKRAGITVSTYKFKPDLKEDMLAAKLIISHAGAGSVMEALRNRKKLIVVVNDQLMHNHQAELADAMSEAGYAASATPDTLLSVLENFDSQKLTPLPPRDLQPFAKAVSDLMAVKEEKKKE